MLENRLNIFQHVLKILEIDTEVQKLLIDQVIIYATNIINATGGTYQYLVDNQCPKLSPTDMYHIKIFRNWHHILYSKN